MKKFTKSLFSIIISAIFVFSTVSIAFADSNKNYPIIIVPGIQNAPVYQNLGTAQEKQVYAPDIAAEELLKLAKGLSKIQDYDNHYEFQKEVFVPTLQKWCDPLKCDSNGDDIYNNGVYLSTASYAEDPEYVSSGGGVGGNYAELFAKIAGPENVFRFQYDWRDDVVETGKSLRPFVEKVLAKTGAKQVKLVFVSMGGAVSNVYLSEYGNLGDTKSVTYLNCAVQGTTLAGEILSGKLQLNKKAIAPCLGSLVNTVFGDIVSAFEIYFDDINTMWSGEGKDYFYKNFVNPYVAHWTGVAELMPASYAEAAIENCFDPVADAGAIAKIRNYMEYQKNAPEMVKSLQKNGVIVNNISCYNIYPLPVQENLNTGDVIIDTKYESFGATTAKLGETLGDESYKQVKKDDHNHVSADFVVDASTCILPENTWFVKDSVHCLYGAFEYKDGKNFLKWIVSQNEQPTVHDNTDYPQFLKFYPSNGKITPLTMPSDEPVEEENEKKFASSPFVYTYKQITLLGWLCYIGIPAAIIIVLIVLLSKKGKKKNILAGCEIEGLTEITDDMPKKEKKAAQKANKKVTKAYWKENKAHLIAQYKFCNDKMAPYAVPGLTPITDDMSKKDIKAAEKSNAKARKAYYKENKKEIDKDLKANKKQKKADKKQAKKDKKAAKKEKKTAK